MGREHDRIVLSVVLAVETYNDTWEDATFFFSLLYPEVDVVFVGQTNHVATFVSCGKASSVLHVTIEFVFRNACLDEMNS